MTKQRRAGPRAVELIGCQVYRSLRSEVRVKPENIEQRSSVIPLVSEGENAKGFANENEKLFDNFGSWFGGRCAGFRRLYTGGRLSRRKLSGAGPAGS